MAIRRITRPPAPLETVEQRRIRQLMQTLGAVEFVLGTTRPRGDSPGTRQTPGLPDLQFFLPERRRPWPTTRRFVVVEVKRARGGRYRPAQIAYRDLCAAAGVAYIGGSLDDVIAWLEGEGYLVSRRLTPPHAYK